MVKGLFRAMLLAALTLQVVGCKKCHTCIAKDQDGVIRYQYPEACGTKKELSAYADQCQTEYGKYDHSCECGETE